MPKPREAGPTRNDEGALDRDLRKAYWSREGAERGGLPAADAERRRLEDEERRRRSEAEPDEEIVAAGWDQVWAGQEP